MSDEEVIYDEFGEIVFDENGNINEKLLDDYQVNPLGIEPGDAVIVVEKGLRFFHVRKFKVIGTAEPRYSSSVCIVVTLAVFGSAVRRIPSTNRHLVRVVRVRYPV